ncbi:MAG: ribonuclease T2 [Pseudomonadota bacterium]
MRRCSRMLLVVVMALAFGPGWADGNRAGAFDYYVMALSWSPSWCDREGHARGAEQCAPARKTGWMLHGLWPQHERGWPANCASFEPDPSRRTTSAMADIMGSGGLAWHQWKKHGRCAGLHPRDYFALSREAFDSVVRPPVLRRLEKDVRLTASVVEEAWLEVNPTLQADMLTVTCRDGYVQEVRICLTKGLVPRNCGADVVRDCSLDSALFPAIE